MIVLLPVRAGSVKSVTIVKAESRSELVPERAFPPLIDKQPL